MVLFGKLHLHKNVVDLKPNIDEISVNINSFDKENVMEKKS